MRNHTTWLIQKQKFVFPKIIMELRKHQKKVSHWSWYVWPTEKVGFSEPFPKTCVRFSSAARLLRETSLDEWIHILNNLNNLLDVHSDLPHLIIPTIDHARIRHFVQFWLEDVLETTQEYPEFMREVERMSEHFEGEPDFFNSRTPSKRQMS